MVWFPQVSLFGFYQLNDRAAIPVITSEAKQSSFIVGRTTGLLRRFTPRNDERTRFRVGRFGSPAMMGESCR
jgi:hypothetical protein